MDDNRNDEIEDSSSPEMNSQQEMPSNAERQAKDDVVSYKKTATTRKWYQIDVEMIPAKLSYVFVGADRSSVLPFVALYLTSVGLDVQQTGYVFAATFLGLMTGNVFWSVLADKTHTHRIILTVLSVVTFVMRISSVHVSASIGPAGMNQCPIAPTNATVAGSEEEYVQKLVTAMSALAFVQAFCSTPIYSFIDAGVIAKIKSSSEKKDFGRQLLFVAVGFGLAPVITGKILDIKPKMNVSCYFLIYCVSCVFLVLTWIFTQMLYKGIKIPAKSQTHRRVNFRRDIWLTLRQMHVAMFLLTLFVHGFIYSIYLNYLFLFLRSLKASNLLMGLTIASGSASGVVAYFFTTQLIRIFRGTFNSMVVCTLVSSVRFIIFGFLKNPWVIIPLQLALHGISLSFFFSLKSMHLKEIAKPSIHTTMFGIGAFFHLGISMFCGSLAGGRMYQIYGARKMFFVLAAVLFAWSVVLVVYILVGKPKVKGATDNNGAVQVEKNLEQRTDEKEEVSV